MAGASGRDRPQESVPRSETNAVHAAVLPCMLQLRLSSRGCLSHVYGIRCYQYFLGVPQLAPLRVDQKGALRDSNNFKQYRTARIN